MVDLAPPTCSQAFQKDLLVAIPSINRKLHLLWDRLLKFNQIPNIVAYFKQGTQVPGWTSSTYPNISQTNQQIFCLFKAMPQQKASKLILNYF